MRLEPAKGGSSRRTSGPRHRPIPRRTDHEDSPRRRRQLPAAGFRTYGRTGRRRARLHRSDGTAARPPPGWALGLGPTWFWPTRRTPHGPSANTCDGERDPNSHPGPSRPAGPPAPSRQQRRQAARFRPRGIQAAQHWRAMHQPPKAVERDCDPLREDCHRLPGRTPRRSHPHLVSAMIREKLPSSRSSSPLGQGSQMSTRRTLGECCVAVSITRLVGRADSRSR